MLFIITHTDLLHFYMHLNDTIKVYKTVKKIKTNINAKSPVIIENFKCVAKLLFKGENP